MYPVKLRPRLIRSEGEREPTETRALPRVRQHDEALSAKARYLPALPSHGKGAIPVYLALIDATRDVAGSITEPIHWFDQADLVLNLALADTLTREELGSAGTAAPVVPSQDASTTTVPPG